MLTLGRHYGSGFNFINLSELNSVLIKSANTLNSINLGSLGESNEEI